MSTDVQKIIDKYNSKDLGYIGYLIGQISILKEQVSILKEKSLATEPSKSIYLRNKR